MFSIVSGALLAIATESPFNAMFGAPMGVVWLAFRNRNNNFNWKESEKLKGRIQMLRAPERVIWYDRLKEFTGQQKEKFDKLVNKWGFNI